MEQQRPWWVGIRASDISGIEHLFSGGIAIMGTFPKPGFRGLSVEQETGRRFNHNTNENHLRIEDALEQLLSRVREWEPEACFLFQDQLCFSQNADFWQCSVFNNPLELLAPLKDKGISRALFGRHVSTVGSTMMFASELSYAGLIERFPNSRKFVVQVPASAGGHGSVLVDSQEALSAVGGLATSHVVVSEYRDGMVPMNTHLVVFFDRPLILPSSAQLVRPDASGRLLYAGCDFFLPGELPPAVRAKISTFCTAIGELLRAAGYRGVAGIDYLANEEELLFVEINPRFQASSAILNKALITRGQPSLHELHMKAFLGIPSPGEQDSWHPAQACIHVNQGDGFIELDSGHHDYVSPDSRDTRFAKDSVGIRVEMEPSGPDVAIEEGAALGRVLVDKPIIHFHPKMGALANHALTHYGCRPPRLLGDAALGIPTALAKLKFNLFGHCVRLTARALDKLARERRDLTIRDGIAGGLEVRLPHRIHVNVPIKERFALVSAYAIDAADDGGYRLIDLNGDELPLEILPIPEFVGLRTERGTPMVQVGQMFNERLSIEIFYGCVNNSLNGTACQFCELGAEDQQAFTDIADIRELVAFCQSSPNIPMRHVLIGGGTPPESEWSLYYEALAAVRAETNLPVYMMIAPPNDPTRLDELHARGLSEIGMNLELFDRDIARRFMPAKGKLPLDRYWSALERAVGLWGGDGAVRSIMIVGLEPLASTLTGVEELCRRGIMPILSPYRPVPGTPLESCPPPSPEMMFEVWSRGQDIAERFGLRLGPSCIACQNNTIAMPFGHGYRYY